MLVNVIINNLLLGRNSFFFLSNFLSVSSTSYSEHKTILFADNEIKTKNHLY